MKVIASSGLVVEMLRSLLSRISTEVVDQAEAAKYSKAVNVAINDIQNNVDAYEAISVLRLVLTLPQYKRFADNLLAKLPDSRNYVKSVKWLKDSGKLSESERTLLDMLSIPIKNHTLTDAQKVAIQRILVSHAAPFLR